ncbi:hypothetical protein Egran_06955 [Elaphomyces granulatus]|uniref:Major facilitator superfamily (MFS) profile domain-containing protein n=1 Tax=Elaphomyces granulatus TaxID=519963 RepID=A0A232LN82_9EURO|nr:hypothetical protein Egran_06955 [Elaphomyces granulatus]
MTEHEQRLLVRQEPINYQYRTFSNSPPRSRTASGSEAFSSCNENGAPRQDGISNCPTESPLPKRQMAVLAMIALCEQTALNSISPYLPDMASTFPEVDGDNVGVYVGSIASAFALAQFATNFFWGWLSDRVGRKPVILLGTILTAICFIAFGFCSTLWQAILVQALMGMVNGNQGLVSTCLGEITDRSNQSKAFTYLPVLYGIGGITGPILGGSLIFKRNPLNKGQSNRYPYLLPNVLSAFILVVDFILASIFLKESLQDAELLPRLSQRVRNLFSWLWQFTSSSRPTYLRANCSGSYQYQQIPTRVGTRTQGGELDSESDPPSNNGFHHEELSRQEVFNRDTILLLITYLIFALANVSFNSLYPIFAQAPEPIGRGLTPQEIGLSMGFSGAVTIIFQLCVFGRLRDKMGNKWSYRASIFGFIVAFALLPFVGYMDKSESGHLTRKSALLAAELCFVLLVKTVATVGGLTSALLLITNSAPNHSVLGALNGLAQTLSAAGRTAGPFLSGGLFSLASKFDNGEVISFAVFSGVSLLGFLLSLGIRSPNLEAEGFGDGEQIKSDDEENHSD